MKKLFQKKKKGITLVEVILATVLITMLITGIAGAMSYGISSASRANQSSYASYLAQEGIEALRNMRDQSFTNLVNGTHGFAVSGNTWTFSGTSDTTSIYTRQVVITSQDSETKRAVVTVTWAGQTYTQIAEFTTWQDAPPVAGSVGMLVYGDGGTTTDTIKYRLLSANGVWGVPTNTGDVDTGSINKALVSLKLYSSKTRNEKILISKHCAGGSTTYFYAQVWNGSNWGNIQQLGTYANCTNSSSEDYNATYQRSGDLVVAYSDGTVTPKYRVWNGGYWSAQLSVNALTGTPLWIKLQTRPGTNEMMMKTYDSASDSSTMFFNGRAYITANWSAVTDHSTSGGSSTTHYEDFEWSPVAPTKGVLIFGQSNNDNTVTAKAFTANGTGGGTWGSAVNATAITSRFENTDLVARPATTAEFIACAKARTSPNALTCFRSSTVPAWTNPTNNTIASGLDGTGVQMGFDFDYETAGAEGIIVYADETTTPKLKTYIASTNTFNATSVDLTPTGAIAKSAKIKPSPSTNDIFIMIGDANGTFYSQIWDGTANTLYTSPSGKAWTNHGSDGYSSQNFYYDFAWDNTLPAIAHIQNTYHVGTGQVSSQTITLPQPVANGNTIVLAVDAWTGGTCTLDGGTVSDNKGNSYSLSNEADGTTNCVSVWTADVTTGGSNFVITVTPPASRWMTIAAHEYRGLQRPNPAHGSSNNSSLIPVTAATGGNVTINQNVNMIFGAFGHSSPGTIQATPGTSFDYRVYYPDGANEPLYTEDRFTTTSGTYAATQTFASITAYGGVTVAFKPQ